MQYTAQELIKKLDLQPHYEGGWYRSFGPFGIDMPKDTLPEGYGGDRNSASRTYYLLQPGEESAWHKLKSAEVWLWHCGGRLETTLGGEGEAPLATETLHLGPHLDAGDSFTTLVPAGQWQTTRLVEGDFALVSCVVTPSFHIDDFYMPPAKG